MLDLNTLSQVATIIGTVLMIVECSSRLYEVFKKEKVATGEKPNVLAYRFYI